MMMAMTAGDTENLVTVVDRGEWLYCYSTSCILCKSVYAQRSILNVCYSCVCAV